MASKISSYILRHKLISAMILIIIIAASYFGFGVLSANSSQTSYILGTASRDTIISSISGTGQVSVSNQLDIASKVSGDIIKVAVKNGQEVKAGAILLQINFKDAAKSIRDAQISLESAKLSLEKIERGSEPQDIKTAQMQVDNANKALADAEENLVITENKAKIDLENVYSDTKNVLQDTYNKYDDIFNRQLDGIYENNGFFADLAFITNNQQAANNAASARLSTIQALGKFKILIENYPTDQAAADKALIDVKSYLAVFQDFLSNLNDVVNGGIIASSLTQSALNSYKSSVASARSSVSSAMSSIDNQTQTITSQKLTNDNNILTAENKIDDAKSSLLQAQNSLATLEAGNDPLDIKAQRLSVKQAESQLASAYEELEDYAIKAQFDGVVSNLNIKKGDSVSAGTALLSLVSPQQITEVSLNEVDVAKVKLGQKANLTFDAVEDLNITGKVIDVDIIGTVSQGVVSYNLKISMDTADGRIKPGMSVSAAIITDLRQNVLAVPNSAVKISGDNSYVEILDSIVSSTSAAGDSIITSASLPRRQTVTVGLSDDNNTEIISGLNEGDRIVIKTNAATVKTSSQAPSLMQSLTPQRNSTNRSTGGTNSSGSSGAGGAMPPQFNHYD